MDSRLKSICGVLDVQGFSGIVDGKWEFLVRELSFAAPGVSATWSFKTGLRDQKVTKNNYRLRMTQNYQREKVHGLSFDEYAPGSFEQWELGTVIRSIHQLYTNSKQDAFGINNQQLGKILQKMVIPFQDLSLILSSLTEREKEDYEAIYCSYQICKLHELWFPGIKCSLNKCLAQRDWLKRCLDVLHMRELFRV